MFREADIRAYDEERDARPAAQSRRDEDIEARRRWSPIGHAFGGRRLININQMISFPKCELPHTFRPIPDLFLLIMGVWAVHLA
jgi:hypothetical protein